MHLRPEEKILKTYHHHIFPYILRLLKIVFSSIPFFILLYFFREAISTSTFVLAAFIIASLFLLVLAYDGIIYWLDHMLVSNFRVIYIHWAFFTVRKEFEAEIRDIQDIETREKGILSYFRIFDYGEVTIQTAASRVSLRFVNAPDPEGIKHFILTHSP